jgi:hypothetical protein
MNPFKELLFRRVKIKYFSWSSINFVLNMVHDRSFVRTHFFLGGGMICNRYFRNYIRIHPCFFYIQREDKERSLLAIDKTKREAIRRISMINRIASLPFVTADAEN